MIRTICLLLILLNIKPCTAQTDTLKSQKLYNQVIAPTALIAIGLSTLGKPSKNFQQYALTHFPTTNSNAEDYLQYAPGIFMLGCAQLGLKPEHNFKYRAIAAGISYVSTTIIVHALKNITHETRPDGSNSHSFPSGHTTFAFTGAELLHQELKNSQPILSYAGYPIAAFVGYQRIVNNKHYLSDVAVGAGIGLLVTKLTYRYFKPLQKPQNFSKNYHTQLNFTPTVINGYSGFSVSMKL